MMISPNYRVGFPLAGKPHIYYRNGKWRFTGYRGTGPTMRWAKAIIFCQAANRQTYKRKSA
jgi:hypothetical protein